MGFRTRPGLAELLRRAARAGEGEGAAKVELPAPGPDGRIYVNTKTAAAAMGVTPAAVTHWRKRGYLAPLAGSPPRKPLYAWDDVVAAEYTAWQAGLVANGIDVRDLRTAA
jgi:hypothetical protein